MLKSMAIQIKFDRKALLGLALGLSALLVFLLVYGEAKYAAVLLLLFSFAGFFRISPERASLRWALYILWTVVCIAGILFLPWYNLIDGYPYNYMRYFTAGYAYVANTAIIMLLMLLFFALSGRWRFSVNLTLVLLSILVFINGYVFQFRGKEFIFPDIFAARTAMNVAAAYDFTPQKHSAVAAFLVLLVIFSSFCLPALPPVRKIKSRAAVLVLSLAMALTTHLSTANTKICLWQWEGTLINGYYLNFYMSIRDFFVSPPGNYSPALFSELEEKYASEESIAEKRPNIIVIMNESFADMRVFGSELNTNIPVSPFLDTLWENTIRGYALSSVFGGSTANSEFEFLTGCSMHFLPNGCIPYQQCLKGDTYSLPWALSGLGYRCVSTHPYQASGWNRPTVYPYLGFEESSFIEAYPLQDLIRNYVSDREMYEYIIKLGAETQEPLFLFGITMQNHGGYSSAPADFEKCISLEGYSQDYPQAEEYLSLLNHSDKALEYLIEELSDFPEDTVVLFFGDHMPNIEDEFFEELRAPGVEELDYQMLRHTVPFFIWANDSFEPADVGLTSLNYLAPRLMETAGLALPGWFSFLKDTEAVIPAMNAYGFKASDTETFLAADDLGPEQAAMLVQYEALQYNLIFDNKNKSSLFSTGS